MTTPMTRRVERLEEIRRRPLRERVERIMQRLGGRLPASEVEDIVTRALRIPQQRIRDLLDDGLTADQIVERLSMEMGIGGAR